MLPTLIDRSPDLQRLRDEGYEISIAPDGFLVMEHVPYLSYDREVKYGKLITDLTLVGDRTARPSMHTVFWSEVAVPRTIDGNILPMVASEPNLVAVGHQCRYMFSQKPAAGYRDYYQKLTTYVRIIGDHARAVDPNATARTYRVVKPDERESVFCYLENASSRAGITTINEKLRKDKIAIVGLGGTGSYVLDLLAKTPVQEIHLFDGDQFLQHNAFRSPGAPSVEDLEKKMTKVEWFASNYSRMRRGIIPHPQFLATKNLKMLKQMDFVFLCMEGTDKKGIVTFLIENDISFVDTGIGMYVVDEENSLAGLVRLTASTPSYSKHVRKRIPFSKNDENAYTQNIQIADMNALNAALAVIKWKKICGFYADIDQEHHIVYGIAGNMVTNEERKRRRKN